MKPKISPPLTTLGSICINCNYSRQGFIKSSLRCKKHDVDIKWNQYCLNHSATKAASISKGKDSYV